MASKDKDRDQLLATEIFLYVAASNLKVAAYNGKQVLEKEDLDKIKGALKTVREVQFKVQGMRE